MDLEDGYIGQARLDFEREYAEKEQYGEKMLVGSAQFKDYVGMLIENGEKNTKRTHVCFTCWQFISKTQRYQH